MFGPPQTFLATFTYPSGNVYEGSMIAGNKRHGPGTLKWTDGAVYVGDWVNDQMHGQGYLTFPNHSTFQGSFVNNNPSGPGVLVSVNQERLEGQFIFKGRAPQSLHNQGPVGTYTFHGQISSPANPSVAYHGPLTLHLATGLVALPGMTDMTAYVLPYAIQANSAVAPAVDESELGKKLLVEANASVPQAKVVAEAGQAGTPSVAYGYQDPALNQRHPDDHAQYDLLDWRVWVPLWLVAPGVFSTPRNVNAARQQELREQQYVAERAQQGA